MKSSNKHSSAFPRVLPLVLAVAISMLLARNAFANPQTSNSTRESPKPAAYMGLEMLTPDGGTDFSAYLKSVFDSVKKKWFAAMPASVSKGERATVIVSFRIQSDGRVPPDSVKLDIVPSGKDDLDKAAVGAIQTAAPFASLPGGSTLPFIDLRITFFYNTPLGGR